jgi:hypothetical protein
MSTLSRGLLNFSLNPRNRVDQQKCIRAFRAGLKSCKSHYYVQYSNFRRYRIRYDASEFFTVIERKPSNFQFIVQAIIRSMGCSAHICTYIQIDIRSQVYVKFCMARILLFSCNVLALIAESDQQDTGKSLCLNAITNYYLKLYLVFY